MIPLDVFHECIRRLGSIAWDDIAWAERIEPPANAEDFAREAVFVICNSGMKNTVARGIYDRVMAMLLAGRSSREGFGHTGKCTAIDQVWNNRAELFEAYSKLDNEGARIAFLLALPWIGEITVWHLAKNFGVKDVAKPDVHLVRLATVYRTTPQQLCADLAQKTGYRIATVDTILWRACANGVLDSRSGALAERL